MKVALLLALLLAGSAQAAPSFDCRKASSKAERAICASPEASALDSDVAQAYRLALSRLADDANAVARLKQDQQSFVSWRDKFIDNQNLVLTDFLARRRDFLLSIDPTTREGAEGFWRSFWGETRINRTQAGQYEVSNWMSEPILRSWNCGDPQEKGRGRLEGGAVLTGSKGDGMRYALTGRVLVLSIISEPNVESGTSCGHVGKGTDVMFPVMSAQPVRAEDPPSARPATRPRARTLAEVLPMLPASAFDDTMDGIEAAELKDLLGRGDSPNWLYKTLSDTQAVARAKRPFNEVHLTRKSLDSTDLIEVRTLTQKAINYTYWAVDAAGGPLTRHQPKGRARVLNETGDGSSAIMPDELPAPIRRYVETLDDCQYWMGEAGDDLTPARQRELVGKLKKLGCDTRLNGEKALKAQFKDQPRWLGVITRATTILGE